MRRLRTGLALLSLTVLTGCGGGTSAAPTAESAAGPTAPAAAKPSPAVSPSPSPVAAAPSPTPAGATAAPAPPAKPSNTVYVGNTDGEGVYLRKTPVMSDRLQAYADGTALTIIGDEVDGDGQHWRHVRTPDGQEGYVPSMYTVTSPP